MNLQFVRRFHGLKFTFVFSFFFACVIVNGQIQNDFLNKNISRIQLKKYLPVKGTKFHSAIQPYEYLDSAVTAVESEMFAKGKPSLNHASQSENLQFDVSPILFGEIAGDQGRPLDLSLASFGVKSSFALRNKLHLRLSLFGGNLEGPRISSKVVDGISMTLEKTNRFANFNAALTYLPSDIFALQIGKGKHKFGDGHRSLFLSDDAINYPYAKIRTRVWNIEYINLFSAQKSLIRDYDPSSDFIASDEYTYKGKFTSSHLLSWNINPVVNVYFFETIIWQNEDTLSTRGFDINYLNPIIFFRPVEFAVGSSDNAIVGLGSSWKVKDNFQIYGQFVVDEMIFKRFINRTGWWANKYGAQLGFKVYDPLDFKDTYFQMEWNQVRPFLALVVKDVKNYQFQLGTTFLLRGDDIPETLGEEYQNLGSDIFRSYVDPFLVRGNVVGQGLTSNQLSTQLSSAYVFDRKNDGRIFLRFNHQYISGERPNNGSFTRNNYSIHLGLSLNFR